MKKHDYPGKIIAFCGVDGSGKSTLLAEAKRQLEDVDIPCYATKMPSERIRQMGLFRDYHHSHDGSARRQVSELALTVLISGDRMIVQETEVIPALRRGEWVLTDRYVYSGLVCADCNLVRQIAREFLEPDLVILARARPETVSTRVMRREAERGLYYDDTDTRKKIARFDQLAAEHPYFVVIDTEREFEVVRDQLRTELSRLRARHETQPSHI